MSKAPDYWPSSAANETRPLFAATGINNNAMLA